MFNEEHIKRKYFTPILNSKKKRTAVFLLKNNCTFSQLCSLTDEIQSPSNIVYKYIHGNPLPKSYDFLGQLDKMEYIPAADELTTEINWAILSIRKYKSEINLFLEYKKTYEEAFILGHYDVAEEFLNKIESEICCSIWSLEKRFLLLEMSKSPESNKSFLSDFNEINKGFFTPTLAYYISEKSEKNFSVLRYNSEIISILSELDGEAGEANRQYYYFHLNPFEYTKYSEFKYILAFESHSSIIDRYITLIRVFKMLLSDESLNEDLFDFCLSRIQYLIQKFNDPDLIVMYVTEFPETLESNEDKRFDIRVLDFYTSGLYGEAIEELKLQILKFPNRFEYYPLYVKSFLLDRKQFQLPNKQDSIQNAILREMYNQLSKTRDPHTTFTNLSRICKNLSSFSISEGIFSFINSEFAFNNYWDRFNLLSLSFENPLLSQFSMKMGRSIEYLKVLSSKNKKSITLKFFLNKHEKNISLDALEIPERTKSIELAKQYQANRDYFKSSEIWESLVASSKEMPPIYETSVRNLFECYLKLNEIDKAISLYVDNFIVNQFIVQKINCKELHDIIRKNKFKKIFSSINLPLFYTLSNADENEINIAYEKFNSSLNIERPSHLFDKEKGIEKNKLILFYHLTCTTDIFKHSIFIDGSKEGYTERAAICRHLMVLDKKNEIVYKRELDSLTDILIIQEGLQQLDESKIYVNEHGLINNELKEYEGLYDRYKTIANIFKDESKKLIFFAKDGILATMDKNEDNTIESKNIISSHPLKDVFKEIFDVIADKFLHSKFGISAYLSTRIRHGVLLGEIRPIFEKYNLISQKDNLDNNYRDVQFWNNRFRYVGKEYLMILQDEISKLSEKIDKSIFKLIKNNLQIKIQKENPDGWFNYLFEDKELIINSVALKDSKNYQEFIRNVITILWQRTDKNLEHIRFMIQGDVKNTFTDALNEFESQLKNRMNLVDIPDVYTNITTCSTEVQNSIDRIASWFNRSGSQTSDFSLNKVINIVLENVNHSYQSKRIELIKQIHSDLIIKGEYYSHIADLLRIFFDNALKHSIEGIQIIPTEIYVNHTEEWLNIDIANQYPNIQNATAVPIMGEKIINTQKLSTEGKSGFYKAKKILQSDLKDDSNDINLSMDSNGKFCVAMKINFRNLTI